MNDMLTKVFPMPLAPAIDVVSPQRKPPCSASSSVVQPVDTGIGCRGIFARALASSVEPKIGGAGSAIGESDVRKSVMLDWPNQVVVGAKDNNTDLEL